MEDSFYVKLKYANIFFFTILVYMYKFEFYLSKFSNFETLIFIYSALNINLPLIQI